MSGRCKMPRERRKRKISDLIAAKSQVLTINLPPEPLKANIDAPKVSMALINLLNNAMHFTPAKGQIQLNLEKHGSAGWLSVVDTGTGIPEDQVNKIFRPVLSGRKPHDASPPGYGFRAFHCSSHR